MKGKKLITLLVVAVVLIGLAVMSKRQARVHTSSTIGQLVLPDLPVNDITQVVVESPESTATVSRVDGVWVSMDKYGHPTDFSRIREVLIALSQLKVGQTLRVADGQKPSLQMGPPQAPGGGTRVTLSDKAGKTIAGLLLGKEHMRQTADPSPYGSFPDGRYVSADDGKSIFLVSETLNRLADTPQEWLNTEVVNVAAADVDGVTVETPDQATLVLNPVDGKMVLEGLTEDEQMNDSADNTVKSAFSYLRFTDVADPELTEAAMGLDTPVTFRVRTSKGETYTAQIGGKAGDTEDRYLRMRVELAAAPEESAAPEAPDDAEATAAKAKKQKERAEMEASVAELEQRLSRWTYIIPSYKADSLLLKRDTLVKAKENEEASADAPAEVAPAEPTPTDTMTTDAEAAPVDTTPTAPVETVTESQPQPGAPETSTLQPADPGAK